MQRNPKAKSQATILVREMIAAGMPIKFHQALEMVAKMSGFRDWNAMAAAPAAAPEVAPSAPSAPSPQGSADSKTLGKLIPLCWDMLNTCDNTGCDGLTVANEEEVEALRDFLNDVKAPPVVDSEMARFNPKTQIAITWSVDDVLSVRPDLTESEAMSVLFDCKRKHDADIGINWDTLRETASWLFKERELTGTVEFVDENCNDCSMPAVVKLAGQGRVYVEGKPFREFCPDAEGAFKVDGLADEEFPVLKGRLFGNENNDGDIQNGDIQDLLEQLEDAKALPSIDI